MLSSHYPGAGACELSSLLYSLLLSCGQNKATAPLTLTTFGTKTATTTAAAALTRPDSEALVPMMEPCAATRTTPCTASTSCAAVQLVPAVSCHQLSCGAPDNTHA